VEQLEHNAFQTNKTAAYMGFAAMAGRRTSRQLFAGISSSSSVTNNIRMHYLSSTTKQNRAAIRGWTFNECRHSSKPSTLQAILYETILHPTIYTFDNDIIWTGTKREVPYFWDIQFKKPLRGE
jgi:hypothetical protein